MDHVRSDELREIAIAAGNDELREMVIAGAGRVIALRESLETAHDALDLALQRYAATIGIRDRFKKACAAGGVRKVRFHDLRHTYGTLTASAGVPLRVLQGLMGHASYSTTEIYAQWAPDQTSELAVIERAFAPAESRANPAESREDHALI